MPQNREKIQKELIYKIILAQEHVVGPVAYVIANSAGDRYSPSSGVSLSQDPKTAIDEMIASFNQLFGKASLEVSRQAARGLGIAKADLPKSLL